MILFHIASITLALLIDRIVGDPPTWPHPVKWMGRLISFLEKGWNKGDGRKWKGMLMVVIVLVPSYFLSFLIVYACYQFHYLLGILMEGFLIATTIAQKSLKDAAIEVYTPLLEGNLSKARKKVSYIVGRDTDQLDEEGIIRATVETVAENTSDGITAPLFFALIGGAPLSLVYRAINTCDSMVGYKNDRYREFGYFSAKVDDIVNYIPSRMTAWLLLLFGRSPFYTRKQAWSILFKDAKKHPSPNSGWGEAATAILLGIQLGGVNYYHGKVSNRALMGQPIQALQKKHIKEANRLVDKAVLFFYLFLYLGGVLFELAITWSK